MFGRFAPVDDIGSRLADSILQDLSHDKSRANAQQQAKDTAIQLPKPALQGIFFVASTACRKEAIDNRCVESYEESGYHTNEDYGHLDGYPFFLFLLVHQRVVFKREGLMEWFDFVQQVECYYQYSMRC